MNCPECGSSNVRVLSMAEYAKVDNVWGLCLDCGCKMIDAVDKGKGKELFYGL